VQSLSLIDENPDSSGKIVRVAQLFRKFRDAYRPELDRLTPPDGSQEQLDKMLRELGNAASSVPKSPDDEE
jgi:hypothetical protein